MYAEKQCDRQQEKKTKTGSSLKTKILNLSVIILAIGFYIL